MTLAISGDYWSFPGVLADRMRAIGAEAAAEPFDVTLDRLAVSPRSVALRPGGGNAGLAALQARLEAGLGALGVLCRDWRFSPHVTLAYRAGRSAGRAVPPIRWRADSFVLIHSLVGETRHAELGEWPLVARQGELFAEPGMSDDGLPPHGAVGEGVAGGRMLSTGDPVPGGEPVLAVSVSSIAPGQGAIRPTEGRRDHPQHIAGRAAAAAGDRSGPAGERHGVARTLASAGGPLADGGAREPAARLRLAAVRPLDGMAPAEAEDAGWSVQDDWSVEGGIGDGGIGDGWEAPVDRVQPPARQKRVRRAEMAAAKKAVVRR